MQINRFRNIDMSDLARKTYYIRVFSAKKDIPVSRFNQILVPLGFNYHEGASSFANCYEKGYVTEEEMMQIVLVLRSYKGYLRIKYCLQMYARNSRYRETFLEGSRKITYKCAYCGKEVDRRSMVIDHIFPVQKMMDSAKIRRHARMFGIHETNCKKNLAAACVKCNKDKGNKTGLWTVRGLVGKHENLLHVMKLVEGGIAATGIILMIIVFNMY